MLMETNTVSLRSILDTVGKGVQQRQKWNRIRRNFVKGDIVLIADSNAPRGSWLIVRVLETQPGARGLVGFVLVKIKTNTLERPISKLCLLVPASENGE